MFKIIVRGTFDKARLESMRAEEMGQYAKAIKSLDGLEETMEKHFAPMLIKKGFNAGAVKDALKPFYMGYDFLYDLTQDGVEIIWDGHYWIDYDSEEIISVMFKSFQMFKPLFFIPNAIAQKLNAIRNPKLFFLPKLDEPLTREKFMANLLEEVTKRFKKLDAACVIESSYVPNKCRRTG